MLTGSSGLDALLFTYAHIEMRAPEGGLAWTLGGTARVLVCECAKISRLAVSAIPIVAPEGFQEAVGTGAERGLTTNNLTFLGRH
jgi:hypothetical protein